MVRLWPPGPRLMSGIESRAEQSAVSWPLKPFLAPISWMSRSQMSVGKTTRDDQCPNKTSTLELSNILSLLSFSPFFLFTPSIFVSNSASQ